MLVMPFIYICIDINIAFLYRSIKLPIHPLLIHAENLAHQIISPSPPIDDTSYECFDRPQEKNMLSPNRLRQPLRPNLDEESD